MNSRIMSTTKIAKKINNRNNENKTGGGSI